MIVSESEGRAFVQVERSATLALEESNAWFATVERTAGSDDYTEAAGWLRMAVGQTTGSIVIYLRDDVEDEAFDETFVVRLSTNAYGADVIDEKTVTVRDDDDPPEPVETLAPETRTPTAAPVAAAAAPVQVARPAARTATRVPQAARQASTRRQTAARVTPFELRAPGQSVDDSIPVPDHASPVVAAAFLAAVILARVGAEVWYRWRTAAN